MKPEGVVIGCDKVGVEDCWEGISVDVVLVVLDSGMDEDEEEDDTVEVEDVDASSVLDDTTAGSGDVTAVEDGEIKLRVKASSILKHQHCTSRR